jgi:hypothetical protein
LLRKSTDAGRKIPIDDDATAARANHDTDAR